MQVRMGEFGSAQSAIQRGGGVVMEAQIWRVNVVEIVRTTALAMRRRNELLGPLGKYDRISKELATALSRRNLTAANHWSQAWIELLEGVAQAGVGDGNGAQTQLGRAIIVGGQLDHPLTGVALLEQGRLALAAENHRAAAELLAEASFSGYFFDDRDVVTESLRLGWINHVASGMGGVYPPLEAAAGWAHANRLEHVAMTFRLAQAENLARLGQLPEAAAVVDDSERRIGPMRNGRFSVALAYLRALANLSQPSAGGQATAGMKALEQALGGQTAVSLRNFQLVRANEQFDARQISPRVAVDLYAALLGDPAPSDWAQRPLDALAVLKTPHDDAYDRWLLAALDRRDMSLALEIAEGAKRSRFLAALPLGGRLVALRTLLEAPAGELPNQAALERQQLLASFPPYRELSDAAAQLYQQLRSGPVVASAGDDAQALNQRQSAWQENAELREQMLLAMALSPMPSTILFPPLRTTAELQRALAPGEALLVFHVAGGNLFGFLVTQNEVHAWPVGDERQLQRALTGYLRSIGNFNRSRQLSAEDLASSQWREAVSATYELLFGGARLDWAKTLELAIVPDGWLWYLPFEALILPGAGEPTVLIDRLPLHYGPTAALAVGDARPFRRPLHTGIVATQLAGDESIKSLEEVVVGPVRLAPPFAQPGYLLAPLLDELIVLDDVDLDRVDLYGWSPLPRARGRANDSLAAWIGLPYEGPERIMLTGFPTAAESGLKGVRSDDAGREVFHAACGLMAAGARTMLLSRWRTGGQVNLQLVREFVQELPHASAAEAWQRSVLLAREAPLDPAGEPRLKKLDEAGEPPRAEHPFFWAGYLLLDTGTRPATEPEAVAEAAAP
jgi:hypothetical protein